VKILHTLIQFVDPFEDADINGPNHPDVVYNWLELKEYFFDILCGKEHMMSRSASILHVLGSVTVSIEHLYSMSINERLIHVILQHTTCLTS